MLKVKIWHFLKICHHSILKILKIPWAKTLLTLYPRTWNSIISIAIASLATNNLRAIGPPDPLGSTGPAKEDKLVAAPAMQ